MAQFYSHILTTICPVCTIALEVYYVQFLYIAALIVDSHMYAYGFICGIIILEPVVKIYSRLGVLLYNSCFAVHI